jgi:hypothetical protein
MRTLVFFYKCALLRLSPLRCGHLRNTDILSSWQKEGTGNYSNPNALRCPFGLDFSSCSSTHMCFPFAPLVYLRFRVLDDRTEPVGVSSAPSNRSGCVV